MYTYIYVYIYIHIYTCIYIYVYMYVYVHMHVCVHIHLDMQTERQTHAETQAKNAGALCRVFSKVFSECFWLEIAVAQLKLPHSRGGDPSGERRPLDVASSQSSTPPRRVRVKNLPHMTDLMEETILLTYPRFLHAGWRFGRRSDSAGWHRHQGWRHKGALWLHHWCPPDICRGILHDAHSCARRGAHCCCCQGCCCQISLPMLI